MSSILSDLILLQMPEIGIIFHFTDEKTKVKKLGQSQIGTNKVK